MPLLHSTSAVFMLCVSQSCLSFLPSPGMVCWFMACEEIGSKGQMISVGETYLAFV